MTSCNRSNWLYFIIFLLAMTFLAMSVHAATPRPPRVAPPPPPLDLCEFGTSEGFQHVVLSRGTDVCSYIPPVYVDPVTGLFEPQTLVTVTIIGDARLSTRPTFINVCLGPHCANDVPVSRNSVGVYQFRVNIHRTSGTPSMHPIWMTAFGTTAFTVGVEYDPVY